MQLLHPVATETTVSFYDFSGCKAKLVHTWHMMQNIKHAQQYSPVHLSLYDTLGRCFVELLLLDVLLYSYRYSKQ